MHFVVFGITHRKRNSGFERVLYKALFLFSDLLAAGQLAPLKGNGFFI
jgi:hypothetical protein